MGVKQFVPIYWTGFEWKLTGPNSYETVQAAFDAAAALQAPVEVIHVSFISCLSDFDAPINNQLTDFNAEDKLCM